ncbi:hypothetical protein Lesp02_03360 [Lentzea sp. NBRC 105346]|nr:hypothetical protein Lesp02_03360 [Lentzea sp. NBRC 105346]
MTAAPAAPRVISDGIEVTDDAVWTWVQIPDGATELMEDNELTAATLSSAAALSTHLPPGADWHIKVLWSRHSSDAYRAVWDATPGVRAPGADYYIELGAHRIDRNSEAGYYRRRVVLLGVRWPTEDDESSVERGRRAAARHLRTEAAAYRAAHARLAMVRPVVDRWFRQIEASVLRARVAPAGLIAWAFAREMRRGTDLVMPDESLLSGARLVALMDGEVDPTQDSGYVVVTDTKTGRRRYVSVLVPAINGFPPDELEIPGGEWLAVLSDLPGVEASVRGVNHGRAGSMTILREARKWSRSQAKEATEAGAFVPEEVDEAQDALAEREREVRRRVDVLTTTHARWVVEADSPGELVDAVETVQKRYTGVVALELVPNIQDLLWLELLPGDQVRVPEFAQLQPMRTLAGSWFHAGSSVGDSTGSYIAGNLGTSPGPVLLHLVSRTDADRRLPTSVSFTGRSGSGKSTSLELVSLSALAEGAWELIVDPKGDLGGIVEVADQVLGVPVQVVDVIDAASSGIMDPMRFAPSADEARTLTLDALLGVLSTEDRRHSETVLEAAIDRVLRQDRTRWSSPAVMGELVAAAGDTPDARLARRLGETLSLRSRQAGIRAVLGGPIPGAPPMMIGRGLVYMSLAGLDMPRHGADPQRWTVAERCAITTFRLALSYALLQSRHIREIPKVVALTELHLITGYPEGKSLIEWLARVGRALKTYLLLDSQSAQDLAQITALIEQLVMSFAFEATGKAEQDAQAVLLHRPNPGPRLRAAQAALGPGQCVVRDRYNRLGLISFDRLTEWIATTLSTDAGEDSETVLGFDTGPDDPVPETDDVAEQVSAETEQP